MAKRSALQTNLIGRKVAFTAPGTYHQRDDLPSGVCEIVAAHLEDGVLQLSILAPNSRIVEASAMWSGQLFTFVEQE